MKDIITKHPGGCKRCHQAIAVGEPAKFIGAGQGITHPECEPAGPEGDMARAVAYLRQKSQEGKVDPFARSLLEQWENTGWLSPRQVSAIVDKRLGAPTREQKAELPGPDVVPAGRYAIALGDSEYVVHIWRGTKRPTYVRVYGYDNGNELTFAQTQVVLAKIVEVGASAAAIRFGQLRGRCWRCDLPLKNNLSVELGSGEECMKHLYSDGVRAARKAAARAAIRARGEDPYATVGSDIEAAA